jgi:thymidylate synthase
MYEKLRKAELIKIIDDLEKKILDFELKIKELRKTELKYETLKTAREEDKKKILEAEQIINNKNKLENELENYYGKQILLLRKDLKESNETAAKLFDMMDNTINLNLNYYTHFKSVFIENKKEGDK